jgi:F-type H+-transporting ATPase subunit gamma
MRGSGTLREMRQRVRGTRKVLQVTQALEQMSSVRLQRSRALLAAREPYTRRLGAILRTVYTADPGAAPALLRPQPAGRSLLLVFGADRGLCGGYAAAIIDAAAAFAAARRPNVSLIVVGRQAHDRLRRQGWSIDQFIPQPPLDHFEEALADLARVIAAGYRGGAYREAHALFGHYAGGSAPVRPSARQLLPVTPEAGDSAAADRPGDLPPGRLDFEPSPDLLMRRLASDYVRALLGAWFLHSVTCEHAARHLSMARAGESARKMIDELTLACNRQRQEAITTEMTELSGGTSEPCPADA